MPDSSPLLSIENLIKAYAIPGKNGAKKQHLKAVDCVSLQIAQGETLGLVGESGCGKSTLGKLVMRLLASDGGQISFRGQELTHLSRREMRPYRRKIQMIFQDPFSSLNPRMTVEQTLLEPLAIHDLYPAGQRGGRVAQLLNNVGLEESAARRYPHEFSGGQRQRISIARALAVEPELIIADEPVSALDLSVQAQILNLLGEIQQQHNLSYLFIAHDLAVVEHVSDRVAVMYLGKIVETAPAECLYRHPQHPYTEALLNAIPVPNPGAPRTHQALRGEIPSPASPPSGCSFHPRCPYANDRCRKESPQLRSIDKDHFTACHYPDKIEAPKL